jgi:hypothetical protein
MSLFSSAPLPHRRKLKGSRVSSWYPAMLPGTRVIVLAGGLLAATVGVLALDGVGSHGNHRDNARQFQRMAGGLGLGATVRPRWCFVNFDPRVERCTCAEEPLPGGYCYCPEHSATVSFFAVPGANTPDGDESQRPDP